jgi:hypothetical protein
VSLPLQLLELDLEESSPSSPEDAPSPSDTVAAVLKLLVLDMTRKSIPSNSNIGSSSARRRELSDEGSIICSSNDDDDDDDDVLEFMAVPLLMFVKVNALGLTRHIAIGRSIDREVSVLC